MCVCVFVCVSLKKSINMMAFLTLRVLQYMYFNSIEKLQKFVEHLCKKGICLLNHFYVISNLP